MRLVKFAIIVLATVFLVAAPGSVPAQQADPYVSCIKCHALPSTQAQGQIGMHGGGYQPTPETACSMCHDTNYHEQNPSAPPPQRYFWPGPPYGPASYLTNLCTSCHPGLHGHKYDTLGNLLLEAMPYGPPSMKAAAAPTSVLPLFDFTGMANQFPSVGGMVCSTCHDPHEPSFPYGSNGMPKFLRVGSPTNINQLCSACHDPAPPMNGAPDLVIPSRSNSVSFSTSPADDLQMTVVVKNRGNAFFSGGYANVSWVDPAGYRMMIGTLSIPTLPPDQEAGIFFAGPPLPYGWAYSQGFFVFTLPPSGLLPGVAKEFVRAMNVTPAPTNLRVSSVTPGSIQLMWDIPVGGPLNYEIYRDGLKINSTPVFPPFIDGALAPETPHVYTVKAVGADGIPSAASNPAGGATTTPAPYGIIRVPQDFPTIQAAIYAAAPGTSIHVAPGTYTEAFSFQGREAITIKGQDANGCVLDYSANPGTIIDLGPAFSYPNGNTLAGFTIRDAKILMYPGDVLSGCVVQSVNMPPMTYSMILAMGGLAAQCVFDAPFCAAEIPPGGFFAAANSAFLYAMPFWHPGTQPAATALLVNNSFDLWQEYAEYQGSGNFNGLPTFEAPGPWPPPGTFFTTQASVTTDRGLPLGTPDTYYGAAPDVGVFEVGRPYTPKPPSGLTATFQPGPTRSVRLDWMPSADAPPRVQYYLVYRGTEQFFPPGSETAPYAVIPAWGVPLTFIDTDVAPGTIYSYQVRADAGLAAPPATGQLLSAPSNTASAGELNRAPLAADDSIQTSENQLMVVLVLANDTDPDGDALTLVSVGQPLHGTAVVTAAPDTNTVTYTPAPSFSGADSFTYTVTDGRGGFATATVNVDVAYLNRPPVAVDDVYATAENQPLTVPPPGVLANDSDPDSTLLNSSLESGPAHGHVMLLAYGEFMYVPDPDFAGTDSFTYRVTDGQAMSNPATVTITVTAVNAAPVANGQSIVTAEDSAALVTLTATDGDGDALTYVVIAGPAHGTLSGTAPNLTYAPAANYHGPDSFTFTASDGTLASNAAIVTLAVTAVNDPPAAAADAYGTIEDTGDWGPSAPGLLLNDTDPDGDALTAVLVSGPAHGTVTVNADGSFRYRPDPNFWGADSFSYRASDGQLFSDPVTVSMWVNWVNDPPAAAGQGVTTVEDTASAVTLSATDVDGEALTYAVVTGPAHGTLSGVAPNLIYTPAANYSGPDSFMFTARDQLVVSNAATVTITVTPVNDPPVATGLSVTTAEDTASAVTLAATDVDGDALTYTVAAGPAHGILSGTAPNLTYMPAENYSGPDSFTFTASDVHATSAVTTVSITVTAVNDLPVANAGADSAGIVGQTLSFSGAASTDLDGTIVSYAWNWGDGTADAAGSNATHAFATAGSKTVTLTVTDDAGGTATDTLVVTVSPAQVNLALNRPVSASSTRSSSYAAAKAVDGKTSTAWMSSKSSCSQWLRVDLGATKSIANIKVFWPATYYARAFTVETSNDGSRWTQRYSSSSGNGSTTSAVFSATARYVRVSVTKPNNASYYGIAELEVYQ